MVNRGVTAETADERGVTPLFLAAKNGHRNVAALLLERGASVNPARQDGMTPQRDVVALLLE
jgi:ankyrin repeat protein